MHAFLAELDDKLPKVGWFRNCLITLGVGTSVLFCCRFYLAFRRAKCNNKVLLSGKTCIITGANTGIGKAVALEFARRKAKVILACRDVQKGNDAAIDIRRSIKDANVNVYQLDLASFTSIRKFVQLYKENENALDILVNNAGLMYAPFTKSEDGIELHFAVNHLGHFLLTNLLLDYMNNHSRIIVVSSALYKKAQLDLINFNEEEIYDAFQAYGKSKLANILFVNELQHYLPPHLDITANSMHPGVVWTELARYKLSNFVTKLLYNFFGFFFLRTPDQGAQTIIYMATDPSLKSITNQYFGDCQIEELLPHARCEKRSSKLWEVSEELTASNFTRFTK
ncbi:retinol dehydrogenase 14 [Hydra vulgaris]|uniref:retinol dehydrogenase 14 n=1 Tax=Hydra vulgaris TaxID=6087 RepID=UPI0001925FE8|nr:retinol dehydrogenase 14 [Hydra vulgaris]